VAGKDKRTFIVYAGGAPKYREKCASLGYLTPAAFKAKHLADGVGGRSPAKPARADVTKNGAPRVDTASEQLAPRSVVRIDATL
jgi:hypothetical protein